jgi:regulatory protein
MQITKLEKISGKKNTFKVFFDDGRSVSLSADIIVKFGLNSGVEISDKTYKEVLRADTIYRAVFTALTLVGRRSYSEKSLYEKLLQKGYDEDNSKAAVKRLKELGYINDEKYAQTYAKYLADKGKGGLAVRKELEQKGISQDLANKALSSFEREGEPYEQIISVIKSKFKNFNANDSSQLRRAANYFLRRGFCEQDISKAFRKFGEV